MRRIASWIDGKTDDASSDHTSPVFDPATGSVQADVALAGPAGVDAAVAAAKAASVRWGDTSIAARTKILFAFRELVASHAGELARIVSSEHGKTIPDAAGEVQRGLEVIEFACGLGQILKGDVNDQVSTGVDAVSFRQPVGVVVGITPFNFPVMVPCWMHPVAIACGNTFVLKPSERDPGASELIAKLWQQAGLPDGVFNVLQGDASVVQQLLGHPDVDAVSFVGSTPIARSVHEQASRTGKRVQALGGAKNHAVVAPDADISFAAKHITAAGYGSAGQRCMAISAVVAVGDVADGLVEELRKLAEDVRVGPGSEASTDMGPVVTATSRDRIIGIIDTVTDEGATLVVDGRKVQVDGHEDGFFVGPTLIDHVRAGMRSYDEEIFGPVPHRHAGERHGRGDRGRERQPVRERCRAVHLVGLCGKGIHPPRARRHGRCERAHPGADGLPQLRRLEGFAVRRSPHPRRGRRALLHARQGRHDPLAGTVDGKRRQRRVGLPLPDIQLTGLTARRAATGRRGSSPGR